MDTWDILTFLGYALVVFILVSCIFKTHIQQPRMFFWATIVFLGANGCNVVSGLVRPDLALTNSPPSAAISLLQTSFSLLARAGLAASLLMMVSACAGSDPAFAKCSNCGYNLTGNNSGTCPECGKNLQTSL